MQYLRVPVLAVALLTLITGCDLAGDNDDIEPIEGTYNASTLLFEVDGEVYDVLDEGGELEMTLQEDGTVENGLLAVPCSIPEACEADEEDEVEVTFEGTYDVDGDIVTFDHDADTFIRDIEWVFEDEVLFTETDDLEVVLEQ